MGKDSRDLPTLLSSKKGVKALVSYINRMRCLVLEGLVTQTRKRPGLNRTVADTTRPAVTVLLAAALVQSVVH